MGTCGPQHIHLVTRSTLTRPMLRIIFGRQGINSEAGILGHGENKDREHPTEIAALCGKSVVQLSVASGMDEHQMLVHYKGKSSGLHAMALTADGTVYTWVTLSCAQLKANTYCMAYTKNNDREREEQGNWDMVTDSIGSYRQLSKPFCRHETSNKSWQDSVAPLCFCTMALCCIGARNSVLSTP